MHANRNQATRTACLSFCQDGLHTHVVKFNLTCAYVRFPTLRVMVSITQVRHFTHEMSLLVLDKKTQITTNTNSFADVFLLVCA